MAADARCSRTFQPLTHGQVGGERARDVSASLKRRKGERG